MAKLLALDQASRISGYAIFDDGKLIKYGKFMFDDYDFGDRLYKIRKKIIELVQTYEINEVAFEDIQLQENVETFKKLAEVFGVVYEIVTELQLPHYIVLASSWKSTLSIKGKQRAQQKKNAQEWVKNTYNISATQDECDAICIGSHVLINKAKNATFDWAD